MRENYQSLTQKINIGDIAVHRIGLGTNRITDTPQAKNLLNRALELGIQFIDTADIYTDQASETMIGKTLSPYPDNIIIATKGGMTRDDRKVDGSPTHLRKTLENSLKRLKLSQIYLYQLHRIDPKVPLADSVGTLKEMQTEGKIKHIGLSEVTVAQIQEAQKIVTIVSVQNEYNIKQRKYEAELDYCTTHNIVFIPWCPLESGKIAENEKYLLATLADKYQATPHQLALAWLLKKSPMMLPIPGTLSLAHLEENLGALRINLTNEDFTALR